MTELSTNHDPMFHDAFAQGIALWAEAANDYRRRYQIVTMALAVSVVINIIAIFWR